MEKSTALPSPPPTSNAVSSAGVSVGVPVGPISMTGSPGFSRAHRSDDPPISRTIVESSPRSRSTEAPVSARPSIASVVSLDLRAPTFRSSEDDRTGRAGTRGPPSAPSPRLRRCSASAGQLHARSRASSLFKRSDEGLTRCGPCLGEDARDDGIATLRAAHRLHDIS